MFNITSNYFNIFKNKPPATCQPKPDVNTLKTRSTIWTHHKERFVLNSQKISLKTRQVYQYLQEILVFVYIKFGTLVLIFFSRIFECSLKVFFPVSILKYTRREKHPEIKFKCLRKSMNIVIQVVGTLKQLFIKGSYTQIGFFKIKVVSGKTLFFVIVPFYNLHSIFLNISF